jgi:hypothetical protein
MIFQVLLAISEFKDKSNDFYHSRVISLTKDFDKYELMHWNYTSDDSFPNTPGIWMLTVSKTSPTEFKIIESELVYDIGLL